MLHHKKNNQFSNVHEHVLNSYNTLGCTAAATFIVHNDNVILEEYVGHQGREENSRPTQKDTQFHVASVRKCYIGFAVSYAIYHKWIDDIDDPVLKYLPEKDPFLWKDTTIRHILTHTHGLAEENGEEIRLTKPGKYWAYRGIGLKALTQIVHQQTGKTIREILHEQVFQQLNWRQSDWYITPSETLADVILHDEDDVAEFPMMQSPYGDGSNMYVSARELAFWGYLHLKGGKINDQQIVPEEMIQMAVQLTSPDELEENAPQNGFLWFVKGNKTLRTEIGSKVPKYSYQILGYTGVTLLVIPNENIVAVRMFNSFGSSECYDYLSDVRTFGDSVMECLSEEPMKRSLEEIE